MPSSEEVYAARDDVRTRAIEHLIQKGHQRHSAEEIVRYMTYEQQAELIGQEIGRPYSPY